MEVCLWGVCRSWAALCGRCCASQPSIVIIAKNLVCGINGFAFSLCSILCMQLNCWAVCVPPSYVSVIGCLAALVFSLHYHLSFTLLPYAVLLSRVKSVFHVGRGESVINSCSQFFAATTSFVALAAPDLGGTVAPARDRRPKGHEGRLLWMMMTTVMAVMMTLILVAMLQLFGGGSAGGSGGGAAADDDDDHNDSHGDEE